MIYNSVEHLSEQVKQNLKKNKFENCLIQIKEFVENIINTSVLNGLIIDLPGLDDLCLEVGREILPSVSVENKNEPEAFVYIATQLYTSGGHTAVLEDFVKIHPDRRQVILLTDIFNRGEDSDIRKRFEGLPVELIFLPPNLSLQERMLWLHKKWIEVNPEKVFLFNHHQDVVAISTAQPGMPGQLYYYHHTDFQLGLGIRLKHAKHIDLRPQTYFHCRENLNLNNVYCPLTCLDLEWEGLKPKNFMENDVVNTASSSGPHKLLQTYLYSYFDIFPEIMKITGGIHLHIGHLPPEMLKLIQEKLISKGISPKKFIYLPFVKSVGKAMIEHNIDVFVSSFPVGGCRTAIEVMASKTPVLCHLNYKSMFLSEYDLFYPEAFTWKNIDDLKNILSKLTPNILMLHSVAARKFYEMNYRDELLLKAFTSHFQEIPVPNLKVQVGSNTNLMQIFIDISVEMNELQNRLRAKEAEINFLFNEKSKLEKKINSSFLRRIKNKLKRLFA